VFVSKFPQLITIAILLLSFGTATGTTELAFDRYRSPEERVVAIREMAQANPAIARTHILAKSPGGRELVILEIGPETDQEQKEFPAVFVAADMEGTVPLSGEAALYLAGLILEKADLRSDLNWYILPCGNPDAAARFFMKPLQRDPRNASAINDDGDDATDEDGPDDLNGDGFLTQMRVKDPIGEWIPVPDEPRLMKKADSVKGEKGLYKL